MARNKSHKCDGPMPYYVGLGREIEPPSNDPKSTARPANGVPPIRGPPIERAAFTIAEFCRAFRISPDMYFKMARSGWGPKIMKVGTKVLISVEAAEAWRREREAAASRDYCVP